MKVISSGFNMDKKRTPNNLNFHSET